MSKIFSFWSIRHRTGASTITLAFANKLAEEIDASIIVIDTNFYSDICNYINKDYSSTIDDLLTIIKHEKHCSLTDIKKSVMGLKDNLDLLPGTAIPSIEYVTSSYSDIEKLVDICSEFYDIILLDLNAGVHNKLTNNLLKKSDVIFNILEQDLCVNDYISKSSLMLREYLNLDTIVHIVNKYDEDVLPDIKQIAELIEAKKIYGLSYCPDLRTSLNNGTFSKYLNQKSEFNKDIETLYKDIISACLTEVSPKEKKKDKGIFALFKGGK